MLSTNEAIKIATAALDKNPELFSFKEIENDTAAYPELLQDIYELIERILEQHNVNDDGLPFRLVFELMLYIGGIQVYLPKPDSIVNGIVKKLIQQEFNGRNHADISQRYRCSTNHIRRVVNEFNE
ncbi:Mor transcription activator family protein [Vibrio parahaemolyticus]|uniref:Mor transcription activator family protein n=1 Tax=Vibrio parahaemolyticus TaxID=670 RepID=UPI000C86AEAC|nr:Mor transcription activator family protein [Vibrio parahaemolyticus]MDF4358359.1 Mor transcription activator family protein [Vibrio parahaemolyticus]MDG2795625.1 Mor transcription activator family protein [Vibrio parahaemolyticus]MDK9426933.1 Mor transcription activator family protein [Vibrio parahaemolyticus]MDK9434269.1 Mor transcription activator family protein [Vibrio parahaemolyticus]MDK9439705.1 Mor transcription activator family protein [Vibrio parahaemolyticus]